MVKAATNARGAGPDEVRDRLWQLRLLFGWVDSQMEMATETDDDDDDENQEGEEGGKEIGGENGLWLRKEFIEEVRWRIWGVQIGDYGR